MLMSWSGERSCGVEARRLFFFKGGLIPADGSGKMLQMSGFDMSSTKMFFPSWIQYSPQKKQLLFPGDAGKWNKNHSDFPSVS